VFVYKHFEWRLQHIRVLHPAGATHHIIILQNTLQNDLQFQNIFKSYLNKLAVKFTLDVCRMCVWNPKGIKFTYVVKMKPTFGKTNTL
jgi:hypothetical protein